MLQRFRSSHRWLLTLLLSGLGAAGIDGLSVGCSPVEPAPLTVARTPARVAGWRPDPDAPYRMIDRIDALHLRFSASNLPEEVRSEREPGAAPSLRSPTPAAHRHGPAGEGPLDEEALEDATAWNYALSNLDDDLFVHRVIEIEGDRRDALYLPAPGSITDYLTIPQDARLELAIGLRSPEGPDPGDGVTFVGQFRESGSDLARELFRIHVDHRRDRARRWHDLSIDLSDFGGKRGALTLSTETGATAIYDYSAFAHPRIVHARARTARSYNLLVIGIDTLRQDMLSLNGGPVSTPALDRIAAEGVHFRNAVSTSSWTAPAVLSMVSGLYPAVYGLDGKHASGRPLPVMPGAPHLFNELRERGWTTWGFQTNPFLIEESVAGTFEEYRYAHNAPADRVTDAAMRWIDRHNDRPFAAYVHYLDPHLPYEPHPGLTPQEAPAAQPINNAELYDRPARGELDFLHDGFESRIELKAWADVPEAREAAWKLYAGEIRYVDQYVGALLEHLRARDLLRNTLVVVVSDHGEEFWDHGLVEHGQNLHREVNDALLIIRPPAGALSDVAPRADPNRLASQIDIRPTVLGLLGIPVASPCQGRDLFSAAGHDRLLMSEGVLYGVPKQGVSSSRWHLLLGRGNHPQLFDRIEDPGEQRDEASLRPDEVQRLSQAYAGHMAEVARVRASLGLERRSSVAAQGPGPEQLEHLRALGYVE